MRDYCWLKTYTNTPPDSLKYHGWLSNFFLVLHWTNVLQKALIRTTSDLIVRAEYARSALNAIIEYIEFNWKMNLKIILTMALFDLQCVVWPWQCLRSNSFSSRQIHIIFSWFFSISATYFNAVFSLWFNFNCRINPLSCIIKEERLL